MRAREVKQAFTIGHSVDPIDVFIGHLKYHKINAIADVRSVPYSRYANQFNKEKLSAALKMRGILYVYMGDSLGARHTEKKLLFEDGRVNFSKVIATNDFNNGICRIEAGISKGYRIAIMCSERNPVKCHRFLISNCLYKKGYEVKHLVGREVLKHSSLLKNLLRYYERYHKITTDLKKIMDYPFIQRSLFGTDEAADRDALCLKLSRAIAYNACTVGRSEEACSSEVRSHPFQFPVSN